MANLTLPELPAIETLTVEAIFPVDSGTQTFKITLENLRKAVFPTGFIDAYAGATPPPGWLLCSGAAVSRGTYAALFDVIGTTFGVGDGSTTFNLPDLRGRVIAGRDDMGGAAASRLTNAVAGFDPTVIGAAGGVQNYTPSGSIGGSQNVTAIGSIGGSQSIAHVHTGPSHNHGIAHTHEWAAISSGGALFAQQTSNNAVTTWSGATAGSAVSTLTFDTSASNVQPWSGSGPFTPLQSGPGVSTNVILYTGGAVSAPSGSGASAATAAGGTGNTGPMSANASVNGSNFTFTGSAVTVNGSNFTFTGSANNKVQPTMILNYVIRF
jgi:microcystin-dependent protein